MRLLNNSFSPLINLEEIKKVKLWDREKNSVSAYHLFTSNLAVQMDIKPWALTISVFHSFNCHSAGKAISQDRGLLIAPHAQDSSILLF